MSSVQNTEAVSDTHNTDTVNNNGSINNNQQNATEFTQMTHVQNINTSTSNTISAAADSSDNLPGTPQPQTQTQIELMNNEEQQTQSSYNPYSSHHLYTISASSTTSSNSPTVTSLSQIYSGSMLYANSNTTSNISSSNMEQQQQLGFTLNNYEQIYQTQQQSTSNDSPTQTSQNQSLNYMSTRGEIFSNNSIINFNKSHQSSGLRYHPYLQTPVSGLPSSSNSLLESVQNSNAISPRIVSSSSPTSTSNPTMQANGSVSSIGSLSGGNSSSPVTATALQCKKCGFFCPSEPELQEHIRNVHSSSPYGSSGYASSPYIKEELRQRTSPVGTFTQPQMQSAGNAGNTTLLTGNNNNSNLLDLDSQKLLFPQESINVSSSVTPHSESNTVSNPLQSMHSMQQRTDIAWIPNTTHTEGVHSYVQSSVSGDKALSSHYIIGNNGAAIEGIKNDYSNINIKHDYASANTETYNTIDNKPFESVNINSGQMLPPAMSSSPAEIPSTTTGGGLQDMQQKHFGSGVFETPSSSSVLSSNTAGSKASNWKSNEARRPKTYNCTACNKWFTSSGHLKRHYNTTLHKNAVKSSGEPDPATLPISAHHHPARDATTKPSRRTNVNINTQPAPVQPPEPPNNSKYSSRIIQSKNISMDDGLCTAVNLPPMAYQGQSLTYHHDAYNMHGHMQTPSSTNVLTSQATIMPGTLSEMSSQAETMQHLYHQQLQQQQQQQQQTVLNGHPNGLAGPSILPTTNTTVMSMPSSQLRGLLNTTTPTSTMNLTSVNTLITFSTPKTVGNTIVKSEIKEMGRQEEQSQKDEVQQHLLQAVDHMSTADIDVMLVVKAEDEALFLEKEGQGVGQVVPEEDLNAAHQQIVLPPMSYQQQEHHLVSVEDQLVHQLEQEQAIMQEEVLGDRPFHNTTPNNMPTQSPLIISQQEYQEHQMSATDNIYSHTPTQLLPQYMEAAQPFSIMPLGINNNMPNNMLQLPPVTTIHTTHTPASTIHTTPTNILNIQGNQQQHLHTMQLQHMESLNIVPEQQQLDTVTNTNMQGLQLPHNNTNINNTLIPSFQHLQQPVSVQLPLADHTMNYPHTIIGSTSDSTKANSISELLTFDLFANMLMTPTHNYEQQSDQQTHEQQQQIITTDGQIIQLIPTNTSNSISVSSATALYSQVVNKSSKRRQSPHEGDLPPNDQQNGTINILANLPSNPILPNSVIYEFDLTANKQTVNPTIGGETINKFLPEEAKVTLNQSFLNFNPSSQELMALDINSYPTVVLDDATVQNIEGNVSKEDGDLLASVSKRKRANKNNGDNAKANGTKKRQPLEIVTVNATSTLLPNGRIKCLPCNKEFTKMCYLTQHNKSFHSGEYPFRCQKCGKRYQCEDAFNTHLTRHRNVDKAHKCELCPKQFHHKTDLRRHIEAIHTGNKQHSCDICDKSFCRKDHLRKHMETHNRPRISKRSSGSSSANNSNSSNRSISKVTNQNSIEKDVPLIQLTTSPPPSQSQSYSIISSMTTMPLEVDGKSNAMKQNFKNDLIDTVNNIEL